MRHVYCQKCADEIILKLGEKHPKICQKCKDEPCPICGKPLEKDAYYCSSKCRYQIAELNRKFIKKYGGET